MNLKLLYKINSSLKFKITSTPVPIGTGTDAVKLEVGILRLHYGVNFVFF